MFSPMYVILSMGEEWGMPCPDPVQGSVQAGPVWGGGRLYPVWVLSRQVLFRGGGWAH